MCAGMPALKAAYEAAAAEAEPSQLSVALADGCGVWERTQMGSGERECTEQTPAAR